MIYIGNWWSCGERLLSGGGLDNNNSNNNNNNNNNNNSKNSLDNLCCSNGVHGWIYLNENGSIYNESLSRNHLPSKKLLLVDGRIAIGLLPELIIPRYENNAFYTNIVRKNIVSLLSTILTFSVIQIIIGLTFGFLLCDIKNVVTL